MILTLIKALETDDLVRVVAALSMAPIDIDLLLYEERDKGNISVDKKTAKVKTLREPESLYYDPVLAEKLVALIRRYDSEEENITFSRMEQNVLDPAGSNGYPTHDFLCTLYALKQGAVEGQPQVNCYEIKVPEVKKKRPGHIFEFYTFLDHQEFGAKAANAFIDHWAKASAKKK